MLIRRALYVMLIVAIASPSAGEAPSFRPVPLVALLTNAKTFDAEAVQTAGYGRYTARGLFLFLTEADAHHRVYMNAIALDVDQSTVEGKALAETLDGEFVTVTGQFRFLGEGALVLRKVSSAVVNYDADSGVAE